MSRYGLEKRNTANLPDGHGGTVKVRNGDLVELLPINPDLPDGKRLEFLCHEADKFLRRYLGAQEAPYKVRSIGQSTSSGAIYLQLEVRDKILQVRSIYLTLSRRI